jgi:hypothetical protein
MSDRRFTFPQVTETLSPRHDERPPDGRRSQRDLVALSLLLHPSGRSPIRFTSR